MDINIVLKMLRLIYDRADYISGDYFMVLLNNQWKLFDNKISDIVDGEVISHTVLSNEYILHMKICDVTMTYIIHPDGDLEIFKGMLVPSRVQRNKMMLIGGNGHNQDTRHTAIINLDKHRKEFYGEVIEIAKIEHISYIIAKEFIDIAQLSDNKAIIILGNGEINIIKSDKNRFEQIINKLPINYGSKKEFLEIYDQEIKS